ncbi:equilibrative nucleoside transporter 3 isoform X4 [Leptinotarsa decemlineata]|uniref:equilibrative nucleoside transporter 3 isoform X4 n=1 Tax=Leptinotarsa decemlineata TaxID=7539 RepID=UPI003D30D166
MEGFKEEADVRFIKMSVISVRQPENGTPPTPGDKYNIVYMLFFFFGLGGVLPNVYFMTATDYWMYKFRDPTQENYDSHKRNQLQANFMGISATIHSVPGLVTTMILTRYGHKIHIRIRILVSLIAIVVIYILFTAFVVVNTDSWQLAFFVLTLVVSTSICDKLFVPTITFLLADIMALTGRFFAKPIFTPNNAKWFAAFDVTRTILMTPLCLFCNALPRRHLPVLFPHDWEYIFLLGSIQLMRAFFSTCSALSMRNLIGDQAELGFLIMQTLGGFTGSIFSLLNPVIVNKL